VRIPICGACVEYDNSHERDASHYFKEAVAVLVLAPIEKQIQKVLILIGAHITDIDVDADVGAIKVCYGHAHAYIGTMVVRCALYVGWSLHLQKQKQKRAQATTAVYLAEDAGAVCCWCFNGKKHTHSHQHRSLAWVVCAYKPASCNTPARTEASDF
jgi:hypothetical protein